MSFKISASNLCNIGQCPFFDKAPFKPNSRVTRGAGIDRHFRNIIEGKGNPPDDTEYYVAKWAADFVFGVEADHSLVTAVKKDCKINFKLGDYTITGEMDCRGKNVFELKSGSYKDYAFQVYPYMLAQSYVSDIKNPIGIVLYCDMQYAKIFTETRQELEANITNAITNHLEKKGSPNINNHFCYICKNSIKRLNTDPTSKEKYVYDCRLCHNL